MIFLLCLVVGSAIVLWFLEECPLEGALEMRRLVKQSYDNERKRRMHRSPAYTRCGWRPDCGLKRRG